MFKRRIYGNGQISIPKKLQKELNIINGDNLFIYLVNNSIIIQTTHHNKTLNQCYFSGGRLSIPMEIRRILNITDKTPLVMDITDDKQKIHINICEK